ncbi:hypothetical protein DES53_10951 [Roseimicrobium gellanilyticum]|uniref:Uncharacterized protein n=2 Tax=Roseimicrobium gellanilyticum TaxID=748857 RepID=A0A366HDD7_9BACT|nr:hypothetical protein DES53_10951 [Roseimicrobium gellanilyticum]
MLPILAEMPLGSLLWFVPLFICAWIASGYVVSRKGWHAFAVKYPATHPPMGRRYTVSTSNFQSGRYQGVVRVVFAEEGIHFSVVILFRSFHEPFLLPWSSVTWVEEQAGAFKSKWFQLHADDEAGSIDLLLPGKVEQDLLTYFRKPLGCPDDDEDEEGDAADATA